MDNNQPGGLMRLWRVLRSPSGRWSVLSLLVVGALIGVGSVIGTQVMVHATGTDEFCGTVCHSMQWSYAEFQQSRHRVNSHGVAATCHDCHLPREYPKVLWVKTAAGTKDIVAEMRGVIDTEEKFKKERLRLAKVVWAGYRENDSANCRNCHAFTPEVLVTQKGFAKTMHEGRRAGNKTCIDCHKGVAHVEPDE